MLKTICGFLFLGALFVGCACDFKCFVDKQFQKVPDASSFDVINCDNVKKEYEGIRKDAKDCSLTKINVDKLEAYANEVCTKEEFRNQFGKLQECFKTNAQTALVCIAQAGFEIKEEDKDNKVEILKAVCKKIDEIYKCVIKTGEVCEEDVKVMTQNLTTAMSTYTTGLCAEANGASVNSVLFLNILFGLLCVLMMWQKN